LRAKGEGKIADDIQHSSSLMLRHLDRELARARFHHARVKASVGAKASVDSLLRTLAKTPDGERLQFHNAIPESVVLAIDQVDFLEVAGNLLENASRYAASEVRVAAEVKDGVASIMVEDDGPGVPEAQIQTILQRGQRLDASGHGAGLGLAIAKDILEAYGGQLRLENRTLAGLSACIILPTA
jgi:signal transduction histidine kinase